MLLKVWAWMLLEASDKPPPRFTTTSNGMPPAVAQAQPQAKPSSSSQTILPAPLQSDAERSDSKLARAPGARAGESRQVVRTRGVRGAGKEQRAEVGRFSGATAAQAVVSALGEKGEVPEGATAAAHPMHTDFDNSAAPHRDVQRDVNMKTCGTAGGSHTTAVHAQCSQQQEAPQLNAEYAAPETAQAMRCDGATVGNAAAFPTDVPLHAVEHHMHGSQASAATAQMTVPHACAAETFTAILTTGWTAATTGAMYNATDVHSSHACIHTHEAEQQWRKMRRVQRTVGSHSRAHSADAAVLQNFAGVQQTQAQLQPVLLKKRVSRQAMHKGCHEKEDHLMHEGPLDESTERLRGCGDFRGSDTFRHSPVEAEPVHKTRASSTKKNELASDRMAAHGEGNVSCVRKKVRVQRRGCAAKPRIADSHDIKLVPVVDTSASPVLRRDMRGSRSRRNGATAGDDSEEIELQGVRGLSTSMSPGGGFEGGLGFVDVVPQPCGVGGNTGGKEWLEGWRLRAAGGVPQQRDGGSCGVFSLAFADCVMRGWWPGVPGANGASTSGAGASPCEKSSGEKRSRGSGRGRSKGGSVPTVAPQDTRGEFGEVPSRGEGEHCQTVCIEFGEVAALRLGLLQELTSGC